MGTYYDGSTYREFRAFSSYIKAAIKDNELGDLQPIHHEMTRRVGEYIFALQRRAKGGESGDFHLAAFVDADFSQLLAEIGRSVAVAE